MALAAQPLYYITNLSCCFLESTALCEVYFMEDWRPMNSVDFDTL